MQIAIFFHLSNCEGYWVRRATIYACMVAYSAGGLTVMIFLMDVFAPYTQTAVSDTLRQVMGVSAVCCVREVWSFVIVILNYT